MPHLLDKVLSQLGIAGSEHPSLNETPRLKRDVAAIDCEPICQLPVPDVKPTLRRRSPESLEAMPAFVKFPLAEVTLAVADPRLLK